MYVEVNAASMEQMLQKCGFNRSTTGKEVVYIRRHKNPNILIKVYTSIPLEASKARGCGKDAIRVVVIYDNGNRNFGIAKLPRVYRTGTEKDVLERTYKRMRDAYMLANKWNKDGKI